MTFIPISKKLYSLNQPFSTFSVESPPQHVSVDCLDREINTSDLERAFLNLNNNKACGQDGILNEFIKNSNDQVKNVTLRIFNKILDTGFFPSQWSVGVIIPIHKKVTLMTL